MDNMDSDDACVEGQWKATNHTSLPCNEDK